MQPFIPQDPSTLLMTSPTLFQPLSFLPLRNFEKQGGKSLCFTAFFTAAAALFPSLGPFGDSPPVIPTLHARVQLCAALHRIVIVIVMVILARHLYHQAIIVELPQCIHVLCKHILCIHVLCRITHCMVCTVVCTLYCYAVCIEPILFTAVHHVFFHCTNVHWLHFDAMLS